MPIIDIFIATKCINNRQNKLVFQKNKASVYFHIFQKKSSLLLFEKWGVMCYIDVKLVILSANCEIYK